MLYHAELPLGVDEGRHGKGRHGAGTEGEVGVDQTSHLGVAFCCSSGVEAGPEHPEEDGSDHREQIAGPVGPGLLAGACLSVVEHPGHSEAKVGAKHVDEDGVASIHGPHVGATDHFVDIEEHNLDEGHEHQLDGSGCSEENAKGDQHGGGGKVSAEHGGEGDVDPGPVRVAVLVVVVASLPSSTTCRSRGTMVVVNSSTVASVIVRVEEAVDEDRPLDAHHGEQHVQGDGGQTVPGNVGYIQVALKKSDTHFFKNVIRKPKPMKIMTCTS